MKQGAKIVAAACCAAGIATGALAADPVRVDVGQDNGRRDHLTPRALNWQIKGGGPASFDLGGGVRARLSAVGGRGALNPVFWKGGLDTGATLATDGVLVANGGRLRLTLSGLSPGRHTLATFHNGVEAKPPGKLQVSVNGEPRVENVTPTHRSARDDEAGSAFVVLEARPGQEIVVEFAPSSPGGAVILNGFELDGSDPTRKARRLAPADGDEHAPEQPELRWTAGVNAKTHQVYFGESREAVAAATPQSPEFRGEQSGTRWPAPGDLDHMKTYFWRVDTLGGDGTTTRGDVAAFRVRHLAFPGAEGYGRFARGGRGGRVIEVTNLGDSGPGSLRAAIDEHGPRTVVFRVGGTIQIKDRLTIRNPYVTIAGQTAPGDGIAVRGAAFGMGGTKDAILRYVRLRVGDASGKTWDGMGFGASDHCIIDHCSIAWSIDEGVSGRGAKNITFQRNLIAEPLNMSIHDHYIGTGKGHGFAGSISGDIGSFHHNLVAHSAGRNWSLAGGLTQGGKFAGYLDIRNNVVYNWVHRTNDGGVRKLNLVNNYYIPGPATQVFHLLIAKMEMRIPGDVQQYYVRGNVMEGRPQYDRDNWQNGGVIIAPADLSAMKLDQPFCEPYVTPQTAREAYESVIADVGANIPHYDAIDRRAVENTKSRTTTFKGSKTGLPGIPDSQNDVGGYPEMRSGEAPADADHDGMADWWETARGLNPADPEDRNALGAGGYTNLELYLNWIVENGGLEPKTAKRPS